MDKTEIDGFLASYGKAWADNDPRAIAAHWDAADPQPIYKAEEVAAPMTDMAQIKAYWAHNERFHDRIRLIFSNTLVKPMTDQQALVIVYMRWDIAFAQADKTFEGEAFPYAGSAMGGENHVVMTMNATADGPKLSAWMEMPDAPLLYMRQLYEKTAAPDFKR